MELAKIDLWELGLRIRDFEDERLIYSFSPSRRNLDIAKAAMRSHLNEQPH
jgi:hypothetical protein